MWKIYASVFLLICKMSLVLALENEQYCFQFRWVTPVFDEKPEKHNCSALKGVPCIKPLIIADQPPNTHAFWENAESSKLCIIKSGNICIKYTFTYNNEVVNTSSYCGKMIEDEITPITSGCYKQNLDGYIIEACACESRRGKEPCNTSPNIQYSVTLFLINLLLIYFIH